MDTQLLFGLRSAPQIFSAYDNGISFCLHYFDDFLTIGTAGTDECERNLQLLTSTCYRLGVPLQREKVECPSTTPTFLGISIDTVVGTLSSTISVVLYRTLNPISSQGIKRPSVSGRAERQPKNGRSSL